MQRGRPGRYELDRFTARLGLAALGRNDFVNRAADGLEELSGQTDLTALLSIWGDQGATVVRWERAASPVVTSFGLGSTLPLLTSASDRVFLAFLPRRLTERRIKAGLDQAAGAGMRWPDLDPSPAGLEAMAAGVQRWRMAPVDGRFVPGLRAASAPVLNWQGAAEAAVTLIGTEESILSDSGPARARLRAFAAAVSLARGG